MPEDLHPWIAHTHKAILRNDLLSFISKSFETVHAGQKFLPNWHIELIAEYLKACEQGEINRLIINLPPRNLKSLCASVAWPAWLLGHNPSRRMIVASYANNLAIKHSLDCRYVMEAPWYREIFPKAAFSKDQNEKHKYLLKEKGFRLGVSTQGAITGEGGNFLIMDDPQNPLHIHKRSYREKTIEWFEQVFLSRADSKKDACFMLVMQRLHENDLSGHLLKKGGWEHLQIPALCSETKEYSYKNFKKYFMQGHALHEEREDIPTLERVSQEMGSSTFKAQYLQEPVPDKGNIIRRQWLTFYENAPEGGDIILSWDSAQDHSVQSTAVKELRVSVLIYMREKGSKKVLEASERIYNLLQDVALTLDSCTLIDLRLEEQVLNLARDGLTYQALLRFKALAEGA